MQKWLLGIIIVLLLVLVALAGTLVWLLARATPTPRPTTQIPQEMAESPNTTVIIRQSAVNDLLQAIFPIEGAGELVRKPVSITYSWKVEKAHVDLEPEGPVFLAEVRLHILGKTHLITAEGRGDIRYDSLAQDLYLDIHEIRAHTDVKILGIPLDKLNLAPSAVNVRLLRHLPLFAHFKVKKPQDVREQVRFAIIGHKIHYEKQRVVVDLALKFTEISQGVGDTAGQGQNKQNQ